jgi:hypothetical protein
MATPSTDPAGGNGARTRTLALVQPAAVALSEGEFAPALLTVELGRLLKVDVPLGAFTMKEGTVGYVSSIDLVGLTAVVMGIGVGMLGVRTVGSVLHSWLSRHH